MPALDPVRASATTDELVVKVATSPSAAGTTLDNVRGYTFQDVLNDVGAGTFVLQNDDAQLALCTFGSYVQWFVNDTHLFTSLIERTEAAEIDPGEEAAEATRVQGRGLVAEWERAAVRPENDYDRKPYGKSRTFGFASPYFDDSTWTFAHQQFRVDDDGPPPSALSALPENAPNPFVYWIWSRPKPAGETPVGTCYFRVDVGILADTFQRLCVSGDNKFIFYVDGLRVLEYQGPSHTDGWGRLYETNIELSEGTHVLAAEVENVQSGVNTAGLYAYLTGYGFTGLFDDPTKMSDTTWLALDYPGYVPGFTYGRVLQILLEEAQADGLLTGWSLGFDAVNDTAGTPWPGPYEITVQTGADYLTVLRQFSESGIDFSVDPYAKTLNAWVKDGKGSASGVVFTDGVNVTERARETMQPSCNRAQVEYMRGITEVASTEERSGSTSEETHGPIRKKIDLTDFESIAAVGDYLEEFFKIWAWPQERVTVGIEPGTGEQPYTDFVLGDTVTVDGESLRVSSFTATVDDVGLVRWAVEVATAGMLSEERLDRMLKAKIAGTVGGRVLAASPTSPGVDGNDPSGKRATPPSLASSGDEVVTGSAGTHIAEAPYRITGAVITSPADGTGTTWVRVRNNTTLESFDISIGADEFWNRHSHIIDVAGGHEVEILCTAAGGHSKVNMTLRAYHV